MNRKSVARQKAIENAAAACGQSVEDFTEALIDRALVCICVPKSPETTRALINAGLIETKRAAEDEA
jgi:hypothetical protein